MEYIVINTVCWKGFLAPDPDMNNMEFKSEVNRKEIVSDSVEYKFCPQCKTEYPMEGTYWCPNCKYDLYNIRYKEAVVMEIVEINRFTVIHSHQRLGDCGNDMINTTNLKLFYTPKTEKGILDFIANELIRQIPDLERTGIMDDRLIFSLRVK